MKSDGSQFLAVLLTAEKVEIASKN